MPQSRRLVLNHVNASEQALQLPTSLVSLWRVWPIKARSIVGSSAITLNPAVGCLRDGAESAQTTAMGTETTSLMVHPEGEQPEVEAWSAVADTYAGRVHVER